MANPVVKCNVSNCTHWGNGNRCEADSILVEIDAHASNSYNMEMSSDSFGEASHQDSASDKAATCCFTFKLRH